MPDIDSYFGLKWRILLHVHSENESYPSRLAEKLRLPVKTVWRYFRELEEEGLLERGLKGIYRVTAKAEQTHRDLFALSHDLALARMPGVSIDSPDRVVPSVASSPQTKPASDEPRTEGNFGLSTLVVRAKSFGSSRYVYFQHFQRRHEAGKPKLVYEKRFGRADNPRSWADAEKAYHEFESDLTRIGQAKAEAVSSRVRAQPSSG